MSHQANIYKQLSFLHSTLFIGTAALNRYSKKQLLMTHIKDIRKNSY